jgi:hypothetical protein
MGGGGGVSRYGHALQYRLLCFGFLLHFDAPELTYNANGIMLARAPLWSKSPISLQQIGSLSTTGTAYCSTEQQTWLPCLGSHCAGLLDPLLLILYDK